MICECPLIYNVVLKQPGADKKLNHWGLLRQEQAVPWIQLPLPQAPSSWEQMQLLSLLILYALWTVFQEALKKASHCNSAPNPQDIQTMVKQYYEATEEATASMHPPRHYLASCYCWFQEEKGHVWSTRGPLPGNRKDRAKGIFCLALEKSETDPNFFPLLHKTNYHRIEKQTRIRRFRFLFPFAGTDLPRKQWHSSISMLTSRSNPTVQYAQKQDKKILYCISIRKL